MTLTVADEQHDKLLGAEAICNFVNTIVDPACAVTPKIIHKWVNREILPTGRFGRQIVASKTAIRQALSGQPSPPPIRPMSRSVFASRRR
jgi:hypothetical protein